MCASEVATVALSFLCCSNAVFFLHAPVHTILFLSIAAHASAALADVLMLLVWGVTLCVAAIFDGLAAAMGEKSGIGYKSIPLNFFTWIRAKARTEVTPEHVGEYWCACVRDGRYLYCLSKCLRLSARCLLWSV